MQGDSITPTGGFSAEELELFAYLVEEEGLDATNQPLIPRRDPNAEIPLSIGQERLWFLDQWDPGNPASNIPFAVRLTGQLAIDAFERSLNEIVRRHEALRTIFQTPAGQPRQVVAPSLSVPLSLIDLRSLPKADHEAEVQRLIMRNAQHRFDLVRGPLLRAELLRLGEQEHVFLLNVHHVVFDAWSVRLFLLELTLLYDAFVNDKPSPLPELAVQYPDFAIWQREWLQDEVLRQQLDYWKRQLGGRLPVLELPGDRPRPPVLTYEGALGYHTIPPALSRKLTTFSQNAGVTLFMTLFAAFQTLLYRYTGEEDIITGSMFANRDFVDIEALMGLFVNTLLLRTDQSDNPTFRDFLQQVREVALEAFAHQNVPFEQLIEELRPPRDTSHTPLFQVMFILQNAPIPARAQHDLQMEFLRVDNKTSKFDLSFSLTEMPDGLRIVAEYRTDLFDHSTIERLLGHYQTLLEGIVEDADRHLSNLPLLSQAERRQLLAWNATAAPYPREAGLHTLFAEQVARTPNAVALIDGQERVCYAELERRSNQLAHYLRAGVGADALVGVCMARSAPMVVALLGILKAGAAYLPLDPRYPVERLAFMIRDACPAAVLIDETGATRLPPRAIGDPPRLDLVAEAATLRAQPEAPPPMAPGGASLAYVIYTSGSTGTPKGVRALHRGAVNRCTWMEQAFPFAPGEVCAQKTALNFVDSVWEIFGPLLAGCPLVIIPDDTVRDIEQLIAVLAEQRVTRLVLVPSLLEAMLQYGDLAPRLPALALWVTSGEQLTTDLCGRFHARLPGRTLINLYGSSEVAADATWYVTGGEAPGRPIPIGRPIANMQVCVLDRRMQLVPIGVPGEIYVGGEGLAEGYHRSDLTAERFVPNPFLGIEDRGLKIEDSSPAAQEKLSSILYPLSSARLYRTGDLGRYRPDGQLEYLGRSDYQVKLRGMRIELGEIETVVAQHSSIRAAVVVLRGDATGDPNLVAYVVPRIEDRGLKIEDNNADGNGQPSSILYPRSSELRAFLRERLPDYMVPAVFVELEAFPLTPSGKVDRKALPAPEQSSAASAHTLVLPRTPVETVLARLWSEVLGREPIGVDDNFFDIGGHSLKATQLLNRVRETFRVNLPLRSLFQATTVATLAELVIANEARPGRSEKIAQMLLRVHSISPEERQRLLEQKRNTHIKG